MIGYLDTSAVVPLIVMEASSPACRRFWDDADDLATSRLTYVETAAALAQAARLGRLAPEAHLRSVGLLDELWQGLAVVEVDATLVARAAELAQRLARRGYDAVHCAAAEQLLDPELVAASGDRRLLAAWSELGIASFDVNRAGEGAPGSSA